MRTITVAELRQNPAGALAAVEGGETFVVTRHRQPIARLAPLDAAPLALAPPRNPNAPRPAFWEQGPLRTSAEIDELLANVASDH